MSSATRSNVWPKRQSDDVVYLINLYFVLVDSKEPSAGPRLADEVFAKNGRWFAAAGYFEGHGKRTLRRTPAENQDMRLTSWHVYRQHRNVTNESVGHDQLAEAQTTQGVPQ